MEVPHLRGALPVPGPATPTPKQQPESQGTGKSFYSLPADNTSSCTFFHSFILVSLLLLVILWAFKIVFVLYVYE